MSGLNGIVLPGEASGKLSFLTSLGIELQGWQKLTYLPKLNDSKIIAILYLIALIISVKNLPNSLQIVENIKPNWIWAISLGLITCFSLLSLNRVSEFLYFQF